jgi:hypothetical protein
MENNITVADQDKEGKYVMNDSSRGRSQRAVVMGYNVFAFKG